MAVSIDVAIDEQKLESSLEIVCNMHPLSKSYVRHDDEELYFKGLSSISKIVYKDFAESQISLEKLLDSELLYSFNEAELLLRLVVVKNAGSINYIVFIFHHVIVDAISGLSFVADVFEHYFNKKGQNQAFTTSTSQSIEYYLKDRGAQESRGFQGLQPCGENKCKLKKKFTLVLKDLQLAKSYALKEYGLTSFSSLLASILLKAIASITDSNTMYRYLCADTRRLFHQGEQLCCQTVGIPEEYHNVDTKTIVEIAQELQKRTYNVLLNPNKLKDFLRHDFEKEANTLGFSYIDRGATKRLENFIQIKDLKLHGVAFYNKKYVQIFAIAYPFRGSLKISIHYDDRTVPLECRKSLHEAIANYTLSFLNSDVTICEW